MPTDCPCGSNKGFSACCEPYLNETALASTPEQLMRSRYSAYALGGFGKYLLDTWFPPMAQGRNQADLDSSESQWQGLRVLSSNVSGDDGEVTFEAYFNDTNGEQVLSENSVFKRIGKRWFYVGGDVSYDKASPLGRNDLCRCGSGKKYKKCCLN